MTRTDPFNEWFQRNWQSLLREFFIMKPRMVFDSFCDTKFVERAENLARNFYYEKKGQTMKDKPTPHEMNVNMLLQTKPGVYEPAGDVIAQRDRAQAALDSILNNAWSVADPEKVLATIRDMARSAGGHA